MSNRNGTATSRQGGSGNIQRFRKGSACPVCGGSDDDQRGEGRRCHGFISGDGLYAHCSRDEHGGGCEYHPTSTTFSHLLKGECRCGKTHGHADANGFRKIDGKGAIFDIEAVYPYRDADGKVRSEAVRLRNPKSFRQRRPIGKDKYEWNTKGCPPLPYNLPEIIEADPDRPIFILEGEKDCDRAMSLGLLASCNSCGAEKWPDSISPYFKGRIVYLVPDNDETGHTHVEKVAASLNGIGREIRIVELPGLPEKGDLSDWLDAGGTVDQLRALAESSPIWMPEPEHAGNGKATKHELTTTDKDCAWQPLSDTGNAHRLINRHGLKLRYCHPWNKWLIWDERRWRMDNTGAVYRFAMATALAIKKESSAKDEKRAIKEHIEWGNMSEGRSRIEAMIALARSIQGVPILPEDLDKDRWLLNVQNGTLDLKTGELRPHRRDDLLTSMAPVEYNPDAACPLWDSTLNLFLANDPEMVRFWQRICGRCLTGDISEQILPILYGSGGNGKSTILATLYGILGTDYALMAPPGLLLQKNNETHPTDRASLFGKRLVIDIESAEDSRLNENFVKQLTGSDPLTVRRMREDFWSFDPTHKLLLATNHKPVIKETKDAIWRRIKLIPFTVKVSKDQEVLDVPERLKAEYSGILTWCLRGLADWQYHGLQSPDKVELATKKYRDDEDTLARFFAEECIVVKEASIRFKVLYERYQRWTEGLGETPKSQKFVGEMLTEKGYEKYTNNGTCYRGIGLVSNPKYDTSDSYDK